MGNMGGWFLADCEFRNKTPIRSEKGKMMGIHWEKAGTRSLQESAETGGRADGCPTQLLT